MALFIFYQSVAVFPQCPLRATTSHSLLNMYYLNTMKNAKKYFGLAAAVATFLAVFGMWAKITHKVYADNMLAAGMWTLAVCTAVYVYLIITQSGKRN